jgi:hypothetical protein
MYKIKATFFTGISQKKKNRRNVLSKLCYTWNVQINKIGIKRFRTILKIHTFKLVTQH